MGLAGAQRNAPLSLVVMTTGQSLADLSASPPLQARPDRAGVYAPGMASADQSSTLPGPLSTQQRLESAGEKGAKFMSKLLDVFSQRGAASNSHSDKHASHDNATGAISRGVSNVQSLSFHVRRSTSSTRLFSILSK